MLHVKVDIKQRWWDFELGRRLSARRPVEVLDDHPGNLAHADLDLGYLTMIVALSVIFLGVKRYRDQELGGVIRFGTAFMLGLGIAAVASLAYVILWEVYLSATDYAFIRDYTESILAAFEADGLVGAALQVEIDSMNELKARYANPLYRLPMTFLDIFPGETINGQSVGPEEHHHTSAISDGFSSRHRPYPPGAFFKLGDRAMTDSDSFAS